MAREPMSDERLAADVLQRWFLSNDPVDSHDLQTSVRVAINALAEVERLRETLNRLSLAYMREVQRNRQDS